MDLGLLRALGMGSLPLRPLAFPLEFGLVLAAWPIPRLSLLVSRPLPDRHVAPPTAVPDRPVLVRTQPAADAGFRTGFSRITNPSVGALPVTRARERGGEYEARGSGVNPGYSSGSGSRQNTGSG